MLATLAVTQQHALAAADTVQRLPSVVQHLYRKRGRLELFPALGWSFNDPFFQQMHVSGGLRYHLLGSMVIGVGADLAAAWQTTPHIIGDDGANMQLNIDRPLYLVRFEGLWAPLYGKFKLWSPRVWRFDMYGGGGLGWMGSRQGASSLSGFLTLGQNIFLNDWMAFKWEAKSHLFALALSDQTPHNRARVHQLFILSLGISFFLPALTAERI